MITELDILRAEHEIMHEANSEWLGLGNEKEDVSYIEGVIQLTDKLLEMVKQDA